MRLVQNILFTLVALLGFAMHPLAAQTLFTEDFQDGEASGWTAGGDGDVAVSSYAGNYSLRLTKKAFAFIGLNVEGPPEVTVSAAFAAAELEGRDACIAEASTDRGATWTEILRIGDGLDDSVTLHTGRANVKIPNANATLVIRLRIAGNGVNDTCWADNIAVTAQRPQARLDAPGPRSALSAAFLLGSEKMDAPVAMRAYGPSTEAEPAVAIVEGTLSFSVPEGAGGFRTERDNFNFTTNPLPRLGYPPSFEMAFVQSGDRLIPTERGLMRTDHAAWDLIVQPGRVWREAEDGAYTRAAIPFALQENNANCTHNGVLTFLFTADGDTSRAVYQIVSETCFYFQYDMWGVADFTYTPQPVEGLTQYVLDDKNDVAARLPAKPISDLAKDHPDLAASAFGAADDISPDHMTTYGLLVDGVHYRAGCQTRYGAYPFCEEMALPSYSVAKSVFAGLALMRLEQLYPGVTNALIEDYVPACKAAGWKGVTFGNALNMATGRYNSREGEVDENAAVQDGFFLAPSHEEKIERACRFYPRKAEPGSVWVYHTTDHYILGAAMQAYLRERLGAEADIYTDLLVEPIWDTVGLSPLADKTRRTRDEVGQPFVGWGLTFMADDLAKLMNFVAIDAGEAGGAQLIAEGEVRAALQKDSADRGLPAPGDAFRYKNGFWAWNAAETLNCKTDVWIPFMSGFGGVSAVMMPNDVLYYYVSDNAEFAWARAIRAANAYAPMCGNRL